MKQTLHLYGAKTVLILFTLIALGGCGAWQSVKDGTIETTHSIFYTKLKSLKLDLIARHGLNQNERGQSLSTVVRIYQLKDGQNFEAAAYLDLLNQDKSLLAENMLESKQVVIRPGESVNINEKFHPEAEYVGIVAFFNRIEDGQSWKLLIPKKSLSNKKAFPIELMDKTIQQLTRDNE